MKTLDTLGLVVAERPGEEFQDGTFKTRRIFLDFLVNGRSLAKVIPQKYDLISCLADWPVENSNSDSIKRLLLQLPADFPNDRRSLYVCPECGDLGCGAVSLRIEKKQNAVIWHDFGYENTYEDKVEREGLMAVGPFTLTGRNTKDFSTCPWKDCAK